ncbi:latent-transforming growth factor beta-binding protein 2-like, partial [Trachinotus anak]|uniref:latent-transforming growth factor beta-binding protein 2-like n=1 Tax=Trachinotus anak TaxID=443729 RepID=UPI0039F22173
MRLSLLCVWTSWILTLHTAAQHHPHREEGAVQPRQREGVLAGRRRHGTGRPSPPRLDANKPVAVRDPGERLGAPAGGRRRAALTGPHVCGGQCCVGWMLSPKTRRCTKPSCFPRCHNRALCRQSNRCVCRRGFHGPRCEFSTVTFSLPGWALTSICPTIIPHRPPVQFNPRRIPPGPTTVPQRTRPAQGHITAARSGPTAISPLPASTRAAEPAATDLNPAETQDKELGAKIPHSGPAKSGLRAEGVYKRSPVLEENLA